MATVLRHLNAARAAIAGWLQDLYVNSTPMAPAGWRFRAYQLGTRLYH